METITRRWLVRAAGLTPGLAALHSRPAAAQARRLKLGVLTDTTGPFSMVSGEGDIAAAKLAVDEFAKSDPGFDIEVVSADFQLKPDVASTIARRWYDLEGVDMITGMPHSASAIAVVGVARDKNKVAVLTATGIPEITGRYCTPNHVQWTMDLYALATCMVRPLIEQGKKSWFFIVPDYVSGQQMADDAANAVRGLGGKVVGTAKYGFPGTTDFSSYLLSGKASGAQVVCFANAGADTITCVKQADEFGLGQAGIRLASIIFNDAVADSIGVDQAKGIIATLPFYWDRDDGTRRFAARFGERYPANPPNFFNAGQYSGVLHYLKAIRQVGLDVAKQDGQAVVRAMKSIPVQDAAFPGGKVRADGKMVHDMDVYEVKDRANVAARWDYFRKIGSVPQDQAYQTVETLGCALGRT